MKIWKFNKLNKKLLKNYNKMFNKFNIKLKLNLLQIEQKVLIESNRFGLQYQIDGTIGRSINP